MEMQPNPELARVAELWDETTRQRAICPIQGWLDSPIVLENYVQPRVSGSPSKNWLEGAVERGGIPRGGRWLSLGCGAAGQEIGGSRARLFGSMVAVDVSPASLDQARQNAAAQGVSNIEFGQADLNAPDLPAAAFDVVLMNMSLHHVRELEHTLAQVASTLKPHGFFVINEFVGPRQFQFTDLQLAIVRELLAVLPPRLRQDSATGQLKTEYVRMPVEHWNVADPSEAIRSDRIVEEVSRRFEIVERIDYGGTILNLLLEHIIHNFDAADEKDVAVIRLLAVCESRLIAHGVLPSDFTVMVSRPRKTAESRLRRLLAGR